MVRLPDGLGRALSGNRPLARILRPLANRVLSKAPRRITVLSGAGSGIKLVIDPQREKFYWTGAYEPAVQKALVEHLRPGMIFWDIGAHTGFYSLIASRLVGASGHVHAFEPMPQNASRLREAISMNGASNVTVHQIALSDRSARALLYRSASSFMWSLVPDQGGTDGEMVACATLDSMVLRLGKPDLLKIDVEGAETAVLTGGRALLVEGNARLIVEFLNPSAIEGGQKAWPSYRFSQLDLTNWLMSQR